MYQNFAFAKVNLFLHIFSKKEDGYHLLEGLFAKLQVHDHVVVEIHEDLISQCDQIIEGPNIAIKAARVLQDYSNTKLGAKITIDKKIPVGAGLGGGSADAATVLKMLNRLWKLNLSNNKLMSIGLLVGADVPFCLQNNPAWVKGIGEQVISLPLLNKKINMLLVNPGYQVLTSEVYKKVKVFSTPVNQGELYKLIFTGKNDLEDAALEICPDLALVKAALKNQNPQVVRMSGSGSTYFAIFDDIKSLELAKANIIKDHPKWQVWQDQVFL